MQTSPWISNTYTQPTFDISTGCLTDISNRRYLTEFRTIPHSSSCSLPTLLTALGLLSSLFPFPIHEKTLLISFKNMCKSLLTLYPHTSTKRNLMGYSFGSVASLCSVFNTVPTTIRKYSPSTTQTLQWLLILLWAKAKTLQAFVKFMKSSLLLSLTSSPNNLPKSTYVTIQCPCYSSPTQTHAVRFSLAFSSAQYAFT